jgi:hypothetical protein
VVATVEIPVSEFVRLQKLPEHEIRRRFDLAPSCDPAISAVRGYRTTVVVIVTCTRADEGTDRTRGRAR